MRWSFTLALFVFSAISSVHALPLPEEFSELVVRGKDNIKESSKKYREAASHSSTSFHTVNGALQQVHHQGPHTPKKGQDAGTIFIYIGCNRIAYLSIFMLDHTHEAQTANHALHSIGQTFGYTI